MAKDTPANRLLCINCRREGHLLSQCPDTFQNDQYGWFFSPARRAFKTDPHASEAPCDRCLSLELASLIAADNCEQAFWKFKSSTPEARVKPKNQWRHLGPVSSLVFDKTCPVCCCLYTCSPSPVNAEQELWIFAFQTISRLGGLFGEDSVNPVRGKGQKQYARCLVPVLWPPTSLDDVDGMVLRGDGLCIVEEEDLPISIDAKAQYKAFALGGRLLSQPSYLPSTLEGWISRCSQLHPSTCQPVWTPDLSLIYLLEVRSRRVIRHPGTACDYLALSYVWGRTTQATYQTGTPLPSLPQTIEDAIAVTLALGKQYLWVDSICIDQSAPEQKAEQISLMCDIYRGAYCTLVAVSSTSATDGLPRVNATVPTFAQLSCSLPLANQGKEVKLATVGLTLSQTIWVTKWGTRAWTFQEALLSARNIYFSEHQIMFECNAMTCCESLDETHSHGHNLLWDDAFIANEKPEENYGLGVLRNPFVGESRRAERMREWGNLLALYMYRGMTDSGDSLNAFNGILKALQEDLYPSGFHWGIPIEQFNIGLLWTSRYGMRRREGFPSWSWCGWEGPVWGPGEMGFTDGVRKQDEHMQPHVKVVAALDREPIIIVDNSASIKNQEKEPEGIDSRLSFLSLGPESVVEYRELFALPSDKYPGALYITAPALKLRNTPIRTPQSSGETQWMHFKVREAIINIAFMDCGGDFEEYLGDEIVDWMVLARENVFGENEKWYLLHLLGVKPNGQELDQGDETSPGAEGGGGWSKRAKEPQVMARVGSMRMWIEQGDQEVLTDLGLKARSILLV